MLIEDGQIAATGPGDTLRAAHPDAAVTDYGDALITPGFVDAHAHYPQTAIIASWGKRLIDWLNTYTFPEEMRFGDPDYAAEAAKTLFRPDPGERHHHGLQLLHDSPDRVDAFFAQAQARGPARGGRQDLHGPQRPRRPARHRAIAPMTTARRCWRNGTASTG